MTLNELIEKLEAAEGKTTPGSWHIGHKGWHPDICELFGGPGFNVANNVYILDANFIALARNSMKTLLAVIRVQNEALESFTKAWPEKHGSISQFSKCAIEGCIELDTRRAREALAKVEELVGGK